MRRLFAFVEVKTQWRCFANYPIDGGGPFRDRRIALTMHLTSFAGVRKIFDEFCCRGTKRLEALVVVTFFGCPF
jgi:hypothetical protein